MMLKKLQEKWQVKGGDLLFIIATFALGGSLCGFLGRKILLLTTLEKGVTWVILYIILITILWPFCVLLVSIPLMQFPFFKRYLARVWLKMNGKKTGNQADPLINIAIFASGTGSNAWKIIEYFKESATVNIRLLVSNKPDSGVVQIARNNNIEVMLTDNERLSDHSFIPGLENRKIGFIILAGFLLKLPPAVIRAYPRKIINIHPALLPAYGGKGMYGMHVHEAIINNSEKQSGITVHFVDEVYDHGEIIFQSACEIDPSDTAETLARKVQQLEHTHFPKVIEGIIKSKINVK